MGQKHKVKRGKSISWAGPGWSCRAPSPGSSARHGHPPAPGQCPELSAPRASGKRSRESAPSSHRARARPSPKGSDYHPNERRGALPGRAPDPQRTPNSQVLFHPEVAEGAAGTAPLPAASGPRPPPRSPPPLLSRTGLPRSELGGFSAREEAMGKAARAKIKSKYWEKKNIPKPNPNPFSSQCPWAGQGSAVPGPRGFRCRTCPRPRSPRSARVCQNTPNSALAPGRADRLGWWGFFFNPIQLFSPSPALTLPS